MLSTPPFTGQPASKAAAADGATGVCADGPRPDSARTAESATSADTATSAGRSEAIQVLRVLSQRHARQRERAGSRDFVVVDHALERDRERLARGGGGDPA